VICRIANFVFLGSFYSIETSVPLIREGYLINHSIIIKNLMHLVFFSLAIIVGCRFRAFVNSYFTV